MARVKILADSTCDLTPALLRQYDITLTPLVVIKDGQQFHDGVDITPSDIFAHVDAGGKLCSTAAVSEYEYTQMFAQGLLVIAAARLAEQGLTGEQIAAQVRALVPKVEASFLVERLDYLYKGGRCSAVAALGANMLKLKPCIEVKDGKMGVCKKYRGTSEHAFSQYVQERLEGRDDIRPELAFITHPAAQPSVVQAAKDAAAKYGAFDEVIETNAGCTVSCHCGPHTLGILFIRK